MTSPAPVSPAVEPSAVEPSVAAEPGDTPGDVAARAWQSMRTLVLDRYDRRKKVCDALGMSFIRAKALRQVAAGPMTMRELADAIGAEPSNLTPVVDRLEAVGLVQRRSRPGDRRIKELCLTPTGDESRVQLENEVFGTMTIFDRLTRPQQALLLRLLDKLATCGPPGRKVGD